MRRKKLSDLLAIPLELDLSFWGGGTYELSAVCLHSGTAHGGHYHAFLRDPEGLWKDANDQRVQILGARQCETLFPKSDDGRAVLHSSDAYFLLYRKCGMNAVDWSAQEVPVPERLSAPILEENQRLLQLQRVYRLHRKLTEVKVFAPKAAQLLLQRFAAQQLQGLCEIPDSVELSVSFTTLDPRPATIRQKALKALAHVDAEWVKTLNLPACEAARLRHFDTLRGIAQKPLEDTFSGGLVHLIPDVGVEAILGDLVLLVHWDQAQPTLSVEQVAAFQLQVKQDAVGERKDLEPEEEPTLTSNPDEVPDLFAEMPRCPDEEPGERRAASATLGELRASAAQRWRLPREATVLVALTGMQAGHELLDDMATLQQCGLSPDDVVCVELRPEKGDPRAKKLYEEKRNTSRMFFNHPDRPEISEEFPAVALSKDSSLAELKARIAGVLGISSDLHLSKSQHAPAMFKDETRTLRQAGFQEIDYVFVGHGAPCGPDESMLKVSRYTYENGNHKVSDGFTFPARGDMSVRSFKEALVKVCADWEEEKLPVTWERLRLRDGQAGKHFAILRDQRTLRSALLGFADGRQVAVQLMPEEEELGPEDMVILVRPWRVMDNRLHAATEVMVSRNQTLAHFQEKMTERFKGLLLDDEDKENHPQDPSECQDMLEICAAHSAGPPMTVKRCETLKWAESRLSERGNPKPLADFKELRDGVTVILRSQRAARHGPAAAQETGKSTGKGPGKPGAKAKAPAQGQKGGAKGPSVTVAAPARERGLVIKVAHPEAEESTM